jgi:GT2 family glycosyltransferase
MVSARTNNPGIKGDKRLKGTKSNPIKDIVLEDTYLPLYCSLCHRELFDRIGGFVKPYPYGWHEDEELAFRMRHHGFRQAICGKSWVHHEGAATVNELLRNNPELIDVMESNKEKCLSDISSL